jgi:hypothetical protein
MTQKESKLFTQILALVLESAIGVGVSLIYCFLSHDNAYQAIISVLLGIGTSCTIELFRISFKINAIRMENSNILSAIHDFQGEGKEHFLRTILKYGGKDISEEIVPIVWNKLILSANKTYKASNYLAFDKLCNQGWSKTAFEIQKLKKTATPKFIISKVFLLDDQINRANILKVTEEQKISGLHIKETELEGLLSDITTKKYVDGSSDVELDFGIYDDSIVLVWLLDKNKNFKGGKLVFDTKEVKKYVDLFSLL